MTFLMILTMFLPEHAHLEQALKAHVTFLADDLLEGRDTTQRGQKIAALYIAAHFSANGVQPLFGETVTPYFQPFNLYKTVLDEDKSFLQLANGAKLELHRDFAFYGLHPGAATWEIEPVFVGFGHKAKKHNYNDYPEGSVEGKYLVMVSGYPPHLGASYKDTAKRREYLREKKIKRAQKAGAAGIIFLANEDFQLPDRRPKPRRSFGRRRSLTMKPVDLMGTDFPVIELVQGRAERMFPNHIEAIRTAITTIATKHEPAPLALGETRLTMNVVFDDQAKSTENVIGLVPGTDPELKDEYLVVTAHYDHVGVSSRGIFNGADDNASGTSVLMELASRIADKPARRSILFMAMTGEEKGLLGSAFFLENCPVPLEKIVANINMDMVGRNDIDDVAIIPAKNRDRSTMNTWIKEINQNLDRPFRLDESLDRYHHRSDHYNFARRDIPALFFFSGDHEDYHQVTDDVEKINFAKMKHIYVLVEKLALRVGNHDQRPEFLQENRGADDEADPVLRRASSENPDGQ